MKRDGFAMLELLIAVAMVAALVGGGFYIKTRITTQGTMPAGGPAGLVREASQTVQQFSAAAEHEQNAIDQLTGQAPITAATTTAVDASVGLGSNKYADGNLPLGDGKYLTTGPKKGYVYVCRSDMTGGGAQESGSWIGTSTWNILKKTAVQGSVSWPNASVSISVQNGTRTIKTNDLPSVGTTGIFPIQPSDPAYAIDRNPNSVKTQALSFTFPANPTMAAAPSCIGGEVGVMTNGVLLFDAFDAEMRDAVAHEMQDSCDGHPQESGEYHYHGPSACLPNDAKTVIGFAFDGFPITGAKLANGNYLTTSDLDECHGLTSQITLDGKSVTEYHYVMTEDFPYSVSCFRGTPTVHGPTAGPNAGGGQPPVQSQGQQPPAEATAACAGKTAGNSCSFTSPRGDAISGQCQTPPGQSQLACVPNF